MKFCTYENDCMAITEKPLFCTYLWTGFSLSPSFLVILFMNLTEVGCCRKKGTRTSCTRGNYPGKIVCAMKSFPGELSSPPLTTIFLVSFIFTSDSLYY